VELERLRGRMPLLAFILLAVLCLLLIGFACACLGDQLTPGLERPLAALAVVVVWLALAAATLARSVLVAFSVPALGRASPAQLQRFLF